MFGISPCGWYHIDYDIALCCVVAGGVLVFSLVVALALCPPLSIELYVGIILPTVATASTLQHQGSEFPNCIVQTIFLQTNNNRCKILPWHDTPF
jgi:hypothetical protein